MYGISGFQQGMKLDSRRYSDGVSEIDYSADSATTATVLYHK